MIPKSRTQRRSKDDIATKSDDTKRQERKVTYDPLISLMEYYAGRKAASRDVDRSTLTVEERLKERIIDGDRIGLDDDLDEAMTTHPPLTIINTFLLDGMKVVGELFGAGKMQLPFVLQSAETMKTAVAHLEPHMEKSDASARGTLVIATVKGDVHDIGKNLVDIILTNNGYRVINLGIKIPIDAMLAAVEESDADALGMSGLLVKSTLVMKENLKIMTDRGISLPVVLGGAALNRRYVDGDLAAIYEGSLAYAEDAFAGLRFMDELADGPGATDSDSTAVPETAVEDEVVEIVPTLRSLASTEERATLMAMAPGSAVVDGAASTEEHPGFLLATDEQIFGGAIARPVDETTTLLDPVVLAADQAGAGRLRDLVQGAVAALRSDDPERSVLLAIDSNDRRRTMMMRGLGFLPVEEAPAGDLVARLGLSDVTLLQARDGLGVAKAEAPADDHDPLLDTERSDVATLDELPDPPFWGSRIVENIALEKIFDYINEVALFRGQWGIRKGSRTADEYRREVDAEIRPRYEELRLQAKRERLLEPRVIYGYFPCRSEGNTIIVYRPADRDESNLHTEWRLPNRTALRAEDLVEWHRFTFPRQRGGRRYALADFFATTSSDRFDVLPCQIVTVGARASEHTAALFEAGSYTDYLYFHGLSVETAEALAEYWHRSIRIELGIADEDAPDIRKLFAQGYRGSRYSFGYPACPDLEDQVGIFRLLDPSRIGIALSEEFMLEPEQSTSAVVVHHPEAKYFSV